MHLLEDEEHFLLEC